MQFTCPFNAAQAAIQLGLTNMAGWFNDDACKVKLMTNDPAISSTTVIADFDEADFQGYAEAEFPGVPWGRLIDPVTGTRRLFAPIPAPGYLFECVGLTNVPQTIYGVYITNTAETQLLAAGKFETPITITGIGEAIFLDPLLLEMVPLPLG